jgi:hypothetical protein
VPASVRSKRFIRYGPRFPRQSAARAKSINLELDRDET